MAGLKYISITKDSNYILVILSCYAIDSRKTLTDIFNNVNEKLKNNESMHHFWGVSQTVTGIDNIPAAYQSSVMLLQKMFYYGLDRIVFYEHSYAEPFQVEDSIFDRLKMFLILLTRVVSCFLISLHRFSISRMASFSFCYFREASNTDLFVSHV